jgi:cytochrome c-type biogenesis protein CcmH/NrfF
MRRLVAMLAVALSLTAVALSLTAAGTALAAGADDLLSVESQFICTTCHEPLELVSSPQALSEKAYLESLLQRHLSMTQVKAAMVSQYGVAVLAKPPADGFNLTVYILPPAVLVSGLALLAYTLPKWRRRARLAAVTPMQGGEPLSSDESARLDAELKNFI